MSTPLNASEILDYYSREDIQSALLKGSKSREVVGMFRSGSFGKRPNTLLYPQDIISQVRQGVVEFHSSIELWDNLSLSVRKGFDLIIDLDCKDFEHGRIAAIVLGKILEKFGVKGYSVKFSGNRGFHVGLPWASIPKEINFQPSASLFPEIARAVGLYLRHSIRKDLEMALLKKFSPESLAESVGKPVEKIFNAGLDPFQIVDIDPVLISPRHLYRMAYSLNMKTFLVSVPVQDLEGFEKSSASPENVRPSLEFLSSGRENEAELLFTESLDWAAKRPSRKPGLRRPIGKKIPQSMFPPCINAIQAGLTDGRKRAAFILVNFLHSMKWKWEEIEVFFQEWNKKNNPPLPEASVNSILRYYRDKKKFPPPNCFQPGWYSSFGVCKPDKICVSPESLKNPVNYPLKLMRVQEDFRKPKGKKSGQSQKPPVTDR